MRALLVEIRLKTLNHIDYLEMPTKKGNNSYRNTKDRIIAHYRLPFHFHKSELILMYFCFVSLGYIASNYFQKATFVI
jgi:hypothetical protein